MKFSHLVQVNDPLNPLIDALTADEVWRGLVLRVENPMLFVYALDGFELLDRDGDTVRRELRFGRATVRDTVTFAPPTAIRHAVEAAGEIPAAALAVTIETPAPEQLFVRFDYETHAVNGAPPVDAFYQGFVKKAYVEADLDAIRTIRKLAVEGKL